MVPEENVHETVVRYGARHCTKCGQHLVTDSELADRVKEAVKGEFGEVRDDNSCNTSSAMPARASFSIFGGGLCKTVSLYGLVNLFVSDEQRALANFFTTLYVGGAAIMKIGTFMSQEHDNSLSLDIKDRLKAYHQKSK